MPDRAPAIAETSLYAPVKAFLAARGFAVKGEVCGCDIVGVRTGEPPVVVLTELKLAFTLELVLQAVDRLRAADELWLAVRETPRDRDARVRRLCRYLGVGLLAVDLARARVTVLTAPGAVASWPSTTAGGAIPRPAAPAASRS